MSGHVGIIAGETGRFTMFSVCLTQLRHPANTQVLWRVTTDRVVGRNAVVRDALEAGTEWLLFLDDDHTFPADILTQLLAHELPVVGGLYLTRAAPFEPVAYREKTDDDVYMPIQLPELPEKGLTEVVACGTGGMLIRAEVFHEMGDPWFEWGGPFSEDLIFCDKVKALGIPIYVDTGIRLGHLGMCSTWPTYTNGGWEIGFQLSDGFSLRVGVGTEPASGD